MKETKAITIPKIQDLYEDKVLTSKNKELALLLNQPPKQEWIKSHPITGVRYMPIERVEYLATNIFSKWWVEIKQTQLLANSIVVTVRVYVINPLNGEEMWQDGVGAMPIQTDKGSGAIEFNKMKTQAIQMSAPAAETFAIKDAFEKFGKLFGKDLNRKDEMDYNILSKSIISEDTIASWASKLTAEKTLEGITSVWSSIPRSLQINEDLILAKDTALSNIDVCE